jgi:hypothetical protein
LFHENVIDDSQRHDKDTNVNTACEEIRKKLFLKSENGKMNFLNYFMYVFLKSHSKYYRYFIHSPKSLCTQVNKNILSYLREMGRCFTFEVIFVMLRHTCSILHKRQR